MEPLDLDHPDDRGADKERVERFVTGSRPVLSCGETLLRKDGSVTWVRVAANLLRDENPESLHSAAIVEDISERKLAEQALQDADRLKDEFMATLAHELRNPLAPMQTAIDLLRHRDRPSTRVVPRCDRKATEASDAARGRPAGYLADHEQQVRGSPSTDRAWPTSSRPPSNRRGHLRAMRSGTRPRDAGQAGVSRWRSRPPRAGVLESAIQCGEIHRRPGHRSSDSGGRRPEIRVSVIDTGIGMSEDELVQAFDKFYQGSRRPERSFGGLGVGLSLVRQLVELHGGTIEARSAGIDRGSEFVVRLRPELARRRPRLPPLP